MKFVTLTPCRITSLPSQTLLDQLNSGLAIGDSSHCNDGSAGGDVVNETLVEWPGCQVDVVLLSEGGRGCQRFDTVDNQHTPHF